MGNEPTTTTPPANTSGLTIEQINAAITAALKPITDTIGTLTQNQRVLGDTIAQLPPKSADDAGDRGKKSGEPLTAESVAKLVSDGIASARKADQEAASKSKAIADAKAKIVKEKLGGDESLATFLPDTDDVASLTSVADTLASKVTPKAKLPGTSADGGLPTARAPVDTSKLNASQKVQLGINQMLAQQVGGPATGNAAT